MDDHLALLFVPGLHEDVNARGVVARRPKVVHRAAVGLDLRVERALGVRVPLLYGEVHLDLPACCGTALARADVLGVRVAELLGALPLGTLATAAHHESGWPQWPSGPAAGGRAPRRRGCGSARSAAATPLCKANTVRWWMGGDDGDDVCAKNND